MLAQKLVTLASTILLLQRIEILPIQGIFDEAPLATSVDPFWALVNLVRENSSTDVLNAVHNILPDVEGCDNEEEEDACIVSQTRTAWTLPLKDLTILAHSAIPT